MTDYPSIAAVDLGSNSFHLLVARQIDTHFQILHKEKQRVSLADGLDNDFYLSQSAIERALDVLKQFAATLDNFPQSHVKVVATYTLRNSKNIQYFLRKASRVFPFKINVISGQEEARLIYQGVANYIHSEHNRLVIDIGGGSTELILGKHFEHKQLTSRNMGCINMSKQYFSEGKISEKRFSKAQIKAEQDLEAVTATYLNYGWQNCLGTSGTIKTLVAISMANFSESVLTLDLLYKIKDLILAAQHANNLNIKGLASERHHSIAGGLVILIALFKQLQIRALTYCDYSLREGLLHEVQGNKVFDIRTRTIDSLCEQYHVDTTHSDNIGNTLRLFFNAVQRQWQLCKLDLQILCWAAQLHEVGLAINSSGLHKHSAYIVMHCQLAGFTQEQQCLLGVLIRFYRKKIKLSELQTLVPNQPKQLTKLITLLRLAIIFNKKRQYKQLPGVDLTANDEKLTLQFSSHWLDKHSILKADLLQEQQYLKPINIDLQIK